MATLSENLSYIYDIKQDIKEVIGTNSDLFSEYPQLIQGAIDEVPAGYTYVSGETYLNLAFNWDDENGAWKSEDDVTSYATAVGFLNQANPDDPSYILSNGLTEVGSVAYGNYNAYVYVNVPPTIPAGYTYVSGDTSIDSSSFEYNGIGYLATVDSTEYATVSCYLGCADPEGWIPEISDNGIWHVDSVAYGNYDAYVYVNVPSSGIIPSGTYNITDNGTYDISLYEYVDVSVSGTPVTTYTWSGLTRGGNPDVNQSGEQSDNENNALMLYVAEGSGWSKKYSQIIPTRQFSYQLPTSITARAWDDYNPSTYIMTESSGCTYSCDPSNYDNLTNVMNTSGGSSGQDCSYEVSGLDVYGLSDYSMTTAGFFGSSVHNLSKLTDLKCIQWNTDDPLNPYEENIKSTMLCAALTDSNHTAYIPETSYFQGMTDVRNLAGRTWKMIFNQYQGRLSLKDIVGPVSDSEVYMNEIDDVWANWMGGWNSSTSSTYNTTTGNIELQYTANYVLSNAPSTAELHQLEYRLISGGTARRIDTEIVGSLGTADHSNLSGTVTLNAIPRTNESFHYVNLFNIDNSDLQNEGYTQYDLTLTLKIPHDMWLYGSANHNQMTLDWVLTPSSAVITDDVTALQTAIGTSWSTGNRISGSYDSTTDKWGTSTRKTAKSPSTIANYRIYEINVTGTISSQQNLIPVITTPMALDYSNPSGSITCSMTERSDQNGVQILTLDTTDFPTKVNATFAIDVPNDALDSSSQNYMKCTVSASIS